MSNVKTYNDENTGIIGKNDYKQKDTHPDQRGRVNIKGLWFWVSGWDKQANGRTFTSLAFTEMTQAEVDTMMEKRAAKQAPQQPQQQRQPMGQPEGTAPHGGGQDSRQPRENNPQPQNQPQDFDDDIPF